MAMNRVGAPTRKAPAGKPGKKPERKPGPPPTPKGFVKGRNPKHMLWGVVFWASVLAALCVAGRFFTI